METHEHVHDTPLPWPCRSRHAHGSDAVCNMPVEVVAAKHRIENAGKIAFFCSEGWKAKLSESRVRER